MAEWDEEIRLLQKILERVSRIEENIRKIEERREVTVR